MLDFRTASFRDYERAGAVRDAIVTARKYVPSAIYETTGEELHAIIGSIIPGVLTLLSILALTTVVGAAAGAALGSLAFGVGAVPGGALGAEAGLDVGVLLLDRLGIGFLAVYIGESVLAASTAAKEAVQLAWHSVDNQSTQELIKDQAAKKLAFAVGLICRGILQGIAAFLLSKGTSAAASRVPELVAKLRASKLADSFATWIEQNWKRLIFDRRFTSVVGDREFERFLADFPETHATGDMLQLGEHGGAARNRAAMQKTGKELESGHLAPQAVMKKVPGYDPKIALTRFLEPKNHRGRTGFDHFWKTDFDALRKTRPNKRATLQELYDIVARALDKTIGLSEGERSSLKARLHDEMLVEPGLNPNITEIEIPRGYHR